MDRKQRLVTTGIMAIIMCGIMSFLVTVMTRGFHFLVLFLWLRNWIIAIIALFPVSYIVTPAVSICLKKTEIHGITFHLLRAMILGFLYALWMTFVMAAVNVGFTERFISAWMGSFRILAGIAAVLLYFLTPLVKKMAKQITITGWPDKNQIRRILNEGIRNGKMLISKMRSSKIQNGKIKSGKIQNGKKLSDKKLNDKIPNREMPDRRKHIEEMDIEEVDIEEADIEEVILEEANAEPVNTEQENTEPANAEPVNTKRENTEPADTEEVILEEADTEPVNTEQENTEPTSTEPGNLEGASIE